MRPQLMLCSYTVQNNHQTAMIPSREWIDV